MTDVRECHLSICNPEVTVYCHEGVTGTEDHPYNRRETIHCSAWNKEYKVCNLTLQPTVVVNVDQSSRHNCDCEGE